MSTTLTTFQRSAVTRVRSVLAAANCVIDSEVVEGNEEKYVIVCFGTRRVIVYEDGAEILGPDLDHRFEIDDFRDIADLEEHLAEDLRQVLG